MKVLISILTLLSSLGSWSIYGIYGQQSNLVCKNFGAAKGRCKLVTTTLAQSGSYELLFIIPYQFDCRGHNLSIGFKTEKESKAINFTKNSTTLTIELTGKGPLELYDPKPKKTYNATLLGPCELKIDQVIVQPSSNTLLNWENTINRLLLVNSSRKNLNELLEYKNSYLALATIADYFLQQLSAESINKMRKTIKEALPAIKKMVNNNEASKTANLSFKERIFLTNLLSQLPKVDQPQVWQGKSLKDFFKTENNNPEFNPTALFSKCKKAANQLTGNEKELESLDLEYQQLCQATRYIAAQANQYHDYQLGNVTKVLGVLSHEIKECL